MLRRRLRDFVMEGTRKPAASGCRYRSVDANLQTFAVHVICHRTQPIRELGGVDLKNNQFGPTQQFDRAEENISKGTSSETTALGR